MKNYEYVAVTENDDDSLRVNFFNDANQFLRKYGEYHLVKLDYPKGKRDCLLEASKSNQFDDNEKSFLEYEYHHYDLERKNKQKFFRIRKTKKEKVEEILAGIHAIPNSVFDVTKY